MILEVLCLVDLERLCKISYARSLVYLTRTCLGFSTHDLGGFVFCGS